MKYLLPVLLLISLSGLIIPNAFAENVPEWVKNTAGWWATDAISETEFVNAIEFLVNENIIQVDTSQATETSQGVPEWVKNTAGWWATDAISETEFVNAIAHLIKTGIITTNEKIIHTDADLRVAFIGDQGLNSNSISVLNLIKDESAHMILHQGDLDYNDDPEGWGKMVLSVLGDDYPYFVTIGDHDRVKWDEYQKMLYDRLEKIPDAKCVGDIGVQAVCTYRGLFFVQVAPGLIGDVEGASLVKHDKLSYFPTEFAPFIDEQLNNNKHMWKICSWAYGMTNTQMGGSDLDTRIGYKDEADWEVYNSCKDGGAIIANAHEHSYSRTKTLIDIENQIVDPKWSEPNKVVVDDGSTFIFVSGIGGHSIRDQGRCLPFFYPYGCNGEWASIYTNNQWATYGALFCTFNVNGQPNKAYCYFKNIDGQIIDAFTVTRLLGEQSNNSNFLGTDMSNKELSSDDFSNTIISDVDLSNSMLIDTNLSNRIFIGTELTNTDFTDTNLSGTSLIGNKLDGTILRGVDLTGANLRSVDLSSVNLEDAILEDADLTGANLRGVDLSSVNLEGTILRGVDLTDANLNGVKLSDRDLSGAKLGIDLSSVNLEGTILRGVDLTDANLNGVKLSTLDLTNANLSGQNLSDHDLTDVILTGADLSKTLLPDILIEKDFTETKFHGVDLSGNDLTKSIFDCIIYTTTVPCNSFEDTNFENSNLNFASFINADLTKIKNKSLVGADLTNASLPHSNLSGINLADSTLFGVNFQYADLTGQDFTNNVLFKETDFYRAKLTNANFEEVNLAGMNKYVVFENKAHLINSELLPDEIAKLKYDTYGLNSNTLHLFSAEVNGDDLHVYFSFVNNFDEADLENVNFKNAELKFAGFASANLKNADLSGADLRYAYLDNTNLSNANLEGANLEGAIINNVILTGANLKCINHSICDN